MGKVESALGIQRQFAPQPKDVYQKQLLVAQGDTTAGKGSKAARLASVLGVLADTVSGEIGRQNARDKKWSAFQMEQLRTNPNIAGKVFTSVQQMIAASGDPHLADNPYTLAAMNKMLGENAAKDIKRRYYEDVVNKQGRCKTSAEEQQRWSSYFQEHSKEYHISNAYQDAVDKSSTTGDSAPNEAASIGTIKPISSYKNLDDDKFFNMGLYENYEVDTQNELNKQAEEAAKNREALRVGTTQAQLAEISSPEWVSSHTAEQLQDEFKRISQTAALSGALLPETMPIVSDFLSNYVANNGSQNLAQLFDTDFWIGVDGQTYKLKDIIPYEKFHGEAIKIDGARREPYIAEITDKLQDCKTLEDFDKVLNGLKNNDNPDDKHVYTELVNSGVVPNMREALRRQIEYDKRIAERKGSSVSRAVSNSIKQYNIAAFNTNTKGWAKALFENRSFYGGRPITAKFQVPGQDKDGNRITRDATNEEIIQAGNGLLGDIITDLQKGNISFEEAVHRESKLLTAPAMSAFKDSIKQAVKGSFMDIGSIDWDKVDYNSPNLRNLQMACDIYVANPSYAGAIFGESGKGNGSLSDIATLVSLADVQDNISYHDVNGVSDGLKKALKMYGAVYNQLTTRKDELNQMYSAALSDRDNTMVDVNNCDVNADESPGMQHMSFLESSYMTNLIEPMSKAYMCLGMNADDAVKKAADIIRGQMYTFASVTFPKDVCVNINAIDRDKGINAKRAITRIVNNMGGFNKDGSPKTIGVYGYTERRFIFTNPTTGEIQIKSIPEFVEIANREALNKDWDKVEKHEVKDSDFKDNPTEHLSPATNIGAFKYKQS